MAILRMPAPEVQGEFDITGFGFAEILADQLSLQRAALTTLYPSSLVTLWLGRETISACYPGDGDAGAARDAVLSLTMRLDPGEFRSMLGQDAVGEIFGPCFVSRLDADFSLYSVIDHVLNSDGDASRAFFRQFNYAPGDMLDNLSAAISAVLRRHMGAFVDRAAALLEGILACRGSVGGPRTDVPAAGVAAFWDMLRDPYAHAGEVVPELLSAVSARISPVCDGMLSAVESYGKERPDWLEALCRHFWELENRWLARQLEIGRKALEADMLPVVFLRGMMYDSALEENPRVSGHWRDCLRAARAGLPV